MRRTDTERLIHTLSESVEPVRPLRRPWVRMLFWAVGAAIYWVALVLVMSPRGDLGVRIHDPRFLIEQGAVLLTGLAAAAAALATSVPGHRPNIVWLPVASAAMWVAIVGIGALRDFRLAGPDGALFQAAWRCGVTVLAGAAVPAVVMARMLRRGAPLTPHLTAALGGLAAAGLGNLGVCLFHPDSSSAGVLLWHCGTVLVVAALAGIAGAQLLRWPPQGRALLS